MSMKKVCNCLLLALLIQVVASCGNLNAPETSKDYSDSSIKTLTITTGATSVARTILPEAMDSSSLTYYFTIDDLINESKTLQIFDSASSGTALNFPIELPEGYYKIRVYALTASAASGYSDKEKYEKPSSEGGFTAGHLANVCVLQGVTTVDLRQDETVSIKLSSASVSGDASVVFNFYTSGWTLDTAKYNATCGIMNKAGNLVGTMSEVDLNSVTNIEPAADAPGLYSATIPAGTYTFFVKYTKLSDSSVVYTWTDYIIVSANQNVKKTIPLFDIIEYAPAAPTDFKASYYDVDPSGDYCYVNFTWTDNSVNERGFMIGLKALQPAEDEANITSDMAANWESLTQYGGAVMGSFTSSGYVVNGLTTEAFDDVPGLCVDGSLDKNHGGSATFKLSRRVRYLARISAVGYGNAGNSDYCYLDLSAGGTGKAGYSAFTTTKYFRVGD